LTGLKLRSLEIPPPARTDLGLKHYLAAVEPPSVLYLDLWDVTDAGLKELAGLRSLRGLSLFSCMCSRTRDKQPLDSPVTDAGLKELAGLKRLRWLRLNDTKVTATGVATLQKELPACKIEGPRRRE
jgi:hypothetical protein